MTYYELIEDSSGNIEVHENANYIDCYSDLESASDWITSRADEGDNVEIKYYSDNTDNEWVIIDDLGVWIYQ